MEEEDRTTEWALLFPLKAGLFAVKSSLAVGAGEAKELTVKEGMSIPEEMCGGGRLRMRRRSSMSDLDKLTSSGALLPDVVRHTHGYDSVPHSPALSRRSQARSVQGSIGDLMNLKRFGGSAGSVRSETLIARTVPLSTVTSRTGSPRLSPERDAEVEEALCYVHTRLSLLGASQPSPNVIVDDQTDANVKLTSSQRTERLSRLIRQQRNSVMRNSAVHECDRFNIGEKSRYTFL
ncbi:uncharacterized protein [Anabrus simplex]|uniref:uncharacterized protein n=1 Tax=Anabrus simplex TaxID=316456 RepID=UPI0035A316B5